MCTRFAVPEMMKAGGGAIVDISSTAGRRGLAYRIGIARRRPDRSV